MTLDFQNYLSASLSGVGRGFLVQSFIYPLEVIKTHQQLNVKSINCFQTTTHLFKTNGWTGFYRGLTPQLQKTVLKQAWCWPMIIEMPRVYNQWGISSLFQQFWTGMSIATLDALVTTPLEKLRITSIIKGNQSFAWNWRGVGAHWLKLSVNWSTFLVAQKYFRDECRTSSELTIEQLMGIGVKVALVVSVCSAPADMLNTLKQGHDIGISKGLLRKMYRGWPLSATLLIINNIASVYLIDKLTGGTRSN